MDLITLALSKSYTNKVAAGFSSVSVEGSIIHFTLNDGQKIDMTIPTPKDGVSVSDIHINDTFHLICTMSDGTIIDAGQIPNTVAAINGVKLEGNKTAVELKIIDDSNISNNSTFSSKKIQEKIDSIEVISELIGTSSKPIVAADLKIGTYVISGIVQCSTMNTEFLNISKREYSVNRDVEETTILYDINPYISSLYYVSFPHNNGKPKETTIELVTKEDLKTFPIDGGNF